MNRRKLAAALRLALEAIEEDEGTATAPSTPPPASKPRRRRTFVAPPPLEGPEDELLKMRAKRELKRQGLVERA